MKSIPIFKGASGLNTKTDPVRLRFNPETGVSDLAACVNCDIDDTGRISRRQGFTATVRTEAWHNLFSCNSYGIGVVGNALAIINADLSYTSIRNVTQNARMSYIRDTNGAKDVIYYSNGYEIGKIIDKVSYSWDLGTYVGATTRKTFSAPPVGHLLEVRSLRMFVAKDNILWYSEPSAYNQFRLAANYFIFPSRIRMVQAVDSGLWVSDSENIYFLNGEIAPTMQEMPVQRKKADYPAIEGTAVKVPGSRIGNGEMQGIVIVFIIPKGICIGSGDGQLINLTERKIDLPLGLTGAGFYKDGKYICTVD